MKLKELSKENRYARNLIVLLKIGVFFLVGFGILSLVSFILVSRAADSRTYQYYGNFYDKRRDTLDAVYIGSSITYTAWLAPLAWERYGIAVSPFSCNSQPFVAAEHVIKEVRKTQPNALYIIPIRPTRNISDIHLHYLADNMPLSWNKIQLIIKMREYRGTNWGSTLEYIFPIIRYHSRWSDLSKTDFFEPLDGFNGSSYYGSFLHTSTDVSSSYYTTKSTVELSETMQTALDDLLEYCDAEKLNVLFVQPADLTTNEQDLAEINSIKNIVEAHGYPVLSLQPSVEGVDLDITKDYYNAGHTNIHGAIKITDYLSQYLVDNYGFEDKRGDPAYNSWDEAYVSYTDKYASVYTLDVEWGREPRDSMLAAPDLEARVMEKNITVSWNAVPGADGYRVYRKENQEGKWKVVKTVSADVFSYADHDCEEKITYYYTVIAYREKDGIHYWGDYDFVGVYGKV